ncbi:hypothetical protein glysoja_037448 [Glycine soja]|uniref:Endonuclease/exonuclease/phosphatase domain-containing protein n=1 Tax=Glycine soja TaxID=3848 RepID=A0A0B2PJ00_GLYSO|nr:hypothetical protein glysoja_037448 [Glycine soja]
MVNKHHADMLCIQESKKEMVDRSLCQAVWGDSEVQWEAQPATNTAGGILCLWSEKYFRLERKINGFGYIMLSGKWIQEDLSLNIVNIYSPCDIQRKHVLWETILQLKNHNQGGLWCILGDFNSIRNSSERVGACHRVLEDGGSREFNAWIEELEVVEPAWVGNKSSDWGPKPFRIMDCWLSNASFKKVVVENWTSNQLSG